MNVELEGPVSNNMMRKISELNGPVVFSISGIGTFTGYLTKYEQTQDLLPYRSLGDGECSIQGMSHGKITFSIVSYREPNVHEAIK